MREIKFRAWDKQMNALADMSNTRVAVTLDGEILEVYIEGNWNFSEVYELMQYTGLKDKNGKEIYEGDILNTNTSTDVVIPYYVETALPFITLRTAAGYMYENGDYYAGSDVQSHQWDAFEIIGNIYENPELMRCSEYWRK